MSAGKETHHTATDFKEIQAMQRQRESDLEAARIRREQEAEAERRRMEQQVRDQLKREAEHKRQQQLERERMEREAERQRAIEARKMADLQKRIPGLEKQLNAVSAACEKSDRQLNLLRKNIDSNRIGACRQQIDGLRQIDAQLRQKLQTLGNAIQNEKTDVSQISRLIDQHQQASRQLLQAWDGVAQEVKANKALAARAMRDIQATQSQLQQQSEAFHRSYQQISAQSDVAAGKMVEADLHLSEENDLIMQELNLLKSDALHSTSAFLEIEAMRRCGYELKGIVQEEEIHLWFEEKSGETKVAIRIKPLASTEGNIQWLKDFRINGTLNETDHSICYDQASALAELGVHYEMTKKDRPKSPPPANIQEWRQAVQKNKTKKPAGPEIREERQGPFGAYEAPRSEHDAKS